MKRKMHKLIKVVALTLVMVMLFGIAMPIASAWNPPPANLPFTDAQNHWARNPIGWAFANGITVGTSPTTFNPERNVTRGEFVTFLHRVAGRPEVPISQNFTDVPVTHDFIRGITWAAHAGVTSGVGDGSRFAPGDPITREQMATMLRNYIRHIGGTYSAPDGALDRFGAADRGRVSGWAVPAVSWAAATGILGIDGNLNPLGRATRAETVTMLHRAVNTFNLPTPPPAPAPAPPPAPDPGNELDALAAEVVRLTNIERAWHGLPPLSSDNATLNAAAALRAREVSTYFSHTRPCGREFFTAFTDLNGAFRFIGENIASSFTSPSSVTIAWMNSPGHRANMLHSSFGTIGVGVYICSHGRIHWVQLFLN